MILYFSLPGYNSWRLIEYFSLFCHQKASKTGPQNLRVLFLRPILLWIGLSQDFGRLSFRHLRHSSPLPFQCFLWVVTVSSHVQLQSLIFYPFRVLSHLLYHSDPFTKLFWRSNFASDSCLSSVNFHCNIRVSMSRLTSPPFGKQRTASCLRLYFNLSRSPTSCPSRNGVYPMHPPLMFELRPLWGSGRKE